MARVAMSVSRGRARGTRRFIAALAAGLLALGAGSAAANERLIKTKKPVFACQEPALIERLHTLVRSGDSAALHKYLLEITARPDCVGINPGTEIYVDQLNVIGQGTEQSINSMLSQALGFQLPSKPRLVVIRQPGETVWRYTLLEFVL